MKVECYSSEEIVIINATIQDLNEENARCNCECVIDRFLVRSLYQNDVSSLTQSPLSPQGYEKRKEGGEREQV